MTTSVDTRLAWEQVATNVGALGLKLKLHLEQGGDSAKPKNEVCEALQKLAAGLDAAFSGAGNAVHDPAVREDATKVAQSLAEALVTTLSEAGEELAETVQGLRK